MKIGERNKNGWVDVIPETPKDIIYLNELPFTAKRAKLNATYLEQNSTVPIQVRDEFILPIMKVNIK